MLANSQANQERNMVMIRQWHTLTREDIRRLRVADRIRVGLAGGTSTVELVKVQDGPKLAGFEGDRRVELTSLIDIPVYSLTKQGAYTTEWQHSQVECWANIFMYPQQMDNATAAVWSLRAGDDVLLEFWPDAQCTQALRAAGFHGDSLYLHVMRAGKRVARWTLATRITDTDSPRLCRVVACPA
jgi:hypothetical protein